MPRKRKRGTIAQGNDESEDGMIDTIMTQAQYTINEMLKRHDEGKPVNKHGIVSPHELIMQMFPDGARVAGHVIRTPPAQQPRKMRRRYEDI